MATDVAIAPTGSIFAPFAIPLTTDLTPLLPTTVAAEALSSFFGGSTTVELSGLGQLLSATDIFRSTLANLQPGSATSGLGENFGTDVVSLAAEAQNFVDAFNTMQANLARLAQAFGVLSAEPLAAQFSQTLNQLVAAPLDSGDSEMTSLEQLGITLQPTPATAGGMLTIDLGTLQSAFESNPIGTFAALGTAVQLFGDTAASFVSQVGRETVTVASLAQLGSGQTTFGSSGLINLLALSSFNSGVATTFTQQLMALNEFMLVSTLLG
jgi:hypothetical protein